MYEVAIYLSVAMAVFCTTVVIMRLEQGENFPGEGDYFDENLDRIAISFLFSFIWPITALMLVFTWIKGDFK